MTTSRILEQFSLGAVLDRRQFFVGLTAILTAPRFLCMEQPASDLKVTTRLVNIYVTVRDKRGAIVQGLKKEDFIIREDGRPQTISFFSHENDLPLAVGLAVDTSPSEAAMIDQEREASRLFFDTVLDLKKDQAFVMHFDFGVELIQDLTNTLPKLDDALNRLEDVVDEPRLDRSRSGNAGDGQDSDDAEDRRPHGTPGDAPGGGSTHLFDAVYLASTRVLKGRDGRKALVVIGDGDDFGSRITKSQAIRAAQQNDVLIYCIRVVDKNFGKRDHRRFSIPIGLGIPGIGGPIGGVGGPGGGQPPGGGGPGGGSGGGPDRSEGRKNLESLAAETGGTLFEVSDKLSLDDTYAQIREELRSQYSLGYTPSIGVGSGYRRIRVTVRKHDNFQIHARDGYYSDFA